MFAKRSKLLSAIALLLCAILLCAQALSAETKKPGRKQVKSSKATVGQKKVSAKAPTGPARTQTQPKAAVAAEPKSQDLGLKMDKDFQALPTFVNSKSLALDTEKRVFTYSGNVVVKHGDLTLTCDALEGNYDQSNQIQTMLARGNVTVIKGENMKATGQRALYNKNSETVTLSENPQLEQNGSTLSATEIKVFLKDNRSVAEGDVRVKLENKEGDKNVKLPGLGK